MQIPERLIRGHLMWEGIFGVQIGNPIPGEAVELGLLTLQAQPAAELRQGSKPCQRYEKHGTDV